MKLISRTLMVLMVASLVGCGSDSTSDSKSGSSTKNQSASKDSGGGKDGDKNESTAKNDATKKTPRVLHLATESV